MVEAAGVEPERERVLEPPDGAWLLVL